MKSSLARRLVVGFGRFWWDFLVGDTPELFLATVLIIVVIFLVSVAGHFNAAAIVLLPLMAIGALALSVRRAAKRRG